MTFSDPRPPADHVARLIAEWRAERPDLAVDPVAVVYRVSRLAGRLGPEVEKVFAGSGVSSADFAVLANLRRAGSPFQLSQRRLMDALGLTSGTISVRVDRLERVGLVRRIADPEDGRGVLVTLTETGERLFDALAPEHLANEARLVAALSPEEQAELARLLQVLLVEFEAGVEPRPDTRLGFLVAPAHVGLARRAAVGLPPAVGLLVDAVRPDGPAAAAGIGVGDLLVRSGDRDLRSLTCLSHAVAAAAAGPAGSVELSLRRGDETTTVAVTLTVT